MAIGPVQLIVLGFDEPEFRGEILAELDRLKENDIVRVIDGLAVHKDAEGEVTVLKRTDLSDEEAAEFGATVGALIGIGIAGEEGAEVGAELGAERTEGGVDLFQREGRPGRDRARSRTTRQRRSSCSSTAGRSRCGMPSSARAACRSRTRSSIRSISSPSA